MIAPNVSPAVLSYTPPDPPLEEFTPARDRAFFADPAKATLLADASAVEELTPHIGTELKGIQLNKLTQEQKDELALLVAEVNFERAKLARVLLTSVEGGRISPGSRHHARRATLARLLLWNRRAQ